MVALLRGIKRHGLGLLRMLHYNDHRISLSFSHLIFRQWKKVRKCYDPIIAVSISFFMLNLSTDNFFRYLLGYKTIKKKTGTTYISGRVCKEGKKKRNSWFWCVLGEAIKNFPTTTYVTSWWESPLRYLPLKGATHWLFRNIFVSY